MTEIVEQPKRKRPIVWIIVWVILYHILSFVIGMPIMAIVYLAGGNVDSLLIDGFSNILAIAIILNKHGYYKEVNVVQSIKRGFSVRLTGVCIVLFIGFQIVMSEVSNYLMYLLPPPEWLNEIFDMLSNGDRGLFGTIFLVVIAAPVVEELIFRKIAIGKLREVYSVRTSIVISAGIFALIHLNIYQMVLAFFAGLILGWLYVKTDSVVICMVCHAVNNGLSFVIGDLLGLEIVGFTTMGDFQPIWFTLLGGVLLVIGGIGVKLVVEKEYA